MQKGTSPPRTSAKTAFTTPLRRTNSVVPGAPLKSSNYQRGVEETPRASPITVPETKDTVLRRTYSAPPGEVGGFIQTDTAMTPTFPTGRSRSPTLANINEALSPRTDKAVEGLKTLSQIDMAQSVTDSVDEDGNIDIDVLNTNTLDIATAEGLLADYQNALKELKKAAEICIQNGTTKYPLYLHYQIHSAVNFVNDCKKAKDEFESSTTDEEVQIKNLCCECGVDMGPDNPRQLCGKTKCDGYGYDDEEEEEETKSLNRSLTPDPLPLPEYGETYQRKERVGEPYAWVEKKQGRGIKFGPRNEYMQPGHKVGIIKNFKFNDKQYVAFASTEDILWEDIASSSEYVFEGHYTAELYDFHKHMELVPYESDEVQTVGGRLNEADARQHQQSMADLMSANQNDVVETNEKKRKSDVEHTTPTKKLKDNH